jgi:hypothetical protein
METTQPNIQPPMHKTIDQALAGIMRDIKAIAKGRESGKDGGPKFKYRGIDDVFNELHDLMAQHGVVVRGVAVLREMTERTTSTGKQMLHHVVKMAYTFCHESGTKSEPAEYFGECAESGDKGLGKAQAYAYKVCLLQTFLIPTEGDNDPDGNSATEWGNQRPTQRQERREQREPRQDRPRQNQPSQQTHREPPPPEDPARVAAKKVRAHLLTATSKADLEMMAEHPDVKADMQKVLDADKRLHAWLVGEIDAHAAKLPTQ